MLDLFARDTVSDEKVSAIANVASEQDLVSTKGWKTSWETPFTHGLPDKVALRRTDDGELLSLMSYDLDENGLAVSGRLGRAHDPGGQRILYLSADGVQAV